MPKTKFQANVSKYINIFFDIRFAKDISENNKTLLSYCSLNLQLEIRNE